MLKHTCLGDSEFDLYYQAVGDGPPVVFLHGFQTNHLSWWQQLAALSSEYHCIAVDQRRFGLSEDTEEKGVSAFVDDLVDLFDTLDINQAVLVGHSMGGWTVSSFATQYPERVVGMVLSATPGGLLSPQRHQVLREKGVETVSDVDPLPAKKQFLSEAISQLNRYAPTDWESTRTILDDFPLDPDRVANAEFPVLLIAGEGDEFMSPLITRKLSDRLDAESAVIDGAGHDLFFEKPQEFNQRLTQFIKDDVEFDDFDQ
jgi:pimeloyl-ACP methyl ester carboxylesterase